MSTKMKLEEKAPLPVVHTCAFQKDTQGYDVTADKPTARLTCSLSLGGVPCNQTICPIWLIMKSLVK